MWMARNKSSIIPKYSRLLGLRDEFSELNGIILRGERILVPTSMRKDILERIQQGHMGIEKSKRRARDVLYWPGVNSEIQGKITSCSICQQHQKQNSKEPMIPSQLPSTPWEKVATDLFTCDKSEHLIIVDYHSRFYEVAKLPDTKSTTVINHIKSAFARHEIPSVIMVLSTHQRNFDSFAKEWEFKHTTTSPLYPQAHGIVEKSVQSVKNLKSKRSKITVIHISDYWNTETHPLMISAD